MAKKTIFLVGIISLLFITIGYAYLNAALSINGSTTIVSNTWDIHFESVTNNSVVATTPASIQGNNTSINYSVRLERPGDFYEFKVDIVNTGSIPAKVSLVNTQGISNEASSYLETSIKYTDGTNVQVDDLLNPHSMKRIVVRV